MEMQGNGIRLVYELAGAGDAVTLVHGLAASRVVFRSLAEQLANEYRVLRYDLRGHGESDKPRDDDFSFEAHVADLAALLDGLSIQRTSLVGWSMGASIAVAFAALHPERVERLVLLSATPSLVQQPDFPFAMPPEQREFALAAASQDFDGFIHQFIQMVLPESVDPAQHEALLGPARQAGAGVYCAIMRQVAAHDIRPWLEGLRAPTLVLHGEQDMLCPPQAGSFLADRISGAAFQLVPGAGHAPFVTRPEAVHPEVMRFLACP
jgi:pimeloyl-[acyl-carrier protein] methyl ester esterase